MGGASVSSASQWGIAGRYRDASGQECVAPESTVAAVLRSMDAHDGSPDEAGAPVFARRGEALPPGAAEVTTEDGGRVEVQPGDVVPFDLPFGYHTVADRKGRGRPLVVSPGRCVLPDRPAWGWAVQLYATRSAASWGVGDLGDLRRLARWSAGDLGAGLILLNPLHAALPGVPQAASPYFPSSRRFRSPLYLRVEEVPGAETLGAQLTELTAAGRALGDDRRIDRDAVWTLKLRALEALWAGFGGDAAFDRWRVEQGRGVVDYATFCVLSEEHGRPWREWPAELRHPARSAVAAFRDAHRRRVDFHAWLQWLLDAQLQTAGSAGVDLVADVAVGFDPAGADGWEWQDVVAPDMAIGAPPDEFNRRGQDWGIPPFDPWRLRSAGYRPFIETLRAAFRHAGGLRLDHVMGLFRLFWVPYGRPPAEGTYVRYPASDLLDILALESHRAGAYVVGEDLGTVEAGMRRELAARDVLSYRLLWFEGAPPSEFPEKALAALSTHDLPTAAGLWTGSDLRDQEATGMEPDEQSTLGLRTRVKDLTGLDDGAGVDQVVEAVYDTLSRAPSLLVTATLDDALAVEERPNMPGTVDEWPNWSIALPLPLEAIEADPRPRRIAERLRRDGHPPVASAEW